MENNPPALPSERRPNWFARNWKWFVPLLVAGCAAVFAGFLVLLLGVMKSSEAYQRSLARVKEDPAVIAALGAPVREGWMFTGNISIENSSGRADLSFPVSGPKGKGTAYVHATRKDGVWSFDEIAVQTATPAGRITLAGPAKSAPLPEEGMAIEKADATDYRAAFAYPDVELVIDLGTGGRSRLVPAKNHNIVRTGEGKPVYTGGFSSNANRPEKPGVFWRFVQKTEAGDLYLLSITQNEKAVKEVPVLYTGTRQIAYDQDGVRVEFTPLTAQ
jgi:hypothetical protein